MVGKPGYQEPEQRAQALESAEARQLPLGKALEKLFNISLDLLCVADFDGYFLIINAAFEKTLG